MPQLKEVKKTIGHDMNGKAIRKSFYGKTKKEATAKYNEYMKQLEAGLSLAASDMTFENWARTWLTTYINEKDLDSQTYASTYKNTVNNHLIPYFGNCPLRMIKPVDVNNFFKTKQENSFSLIHKCDFILRAILETAVDNDLLIKSPYRNISVPCGAEPKPTRSYTAEEAKKHLDFCKTHPFGLLAALPLKTSCSRSEAAALMISDFDTARNVVHICKGMNAVGEIGQGKTGNRPRYVPYDNEFAEMLARHETSGLYLLSRDDTGQPLRPDRIAYRYKKFQKDLLKKHPELPDLRYHELRHTYGTLLNENRVPDNTIALLMGHGKNAKITNEVYIHQNIDHIQRMLGLADEK